MTPHTTLLTLALLLAAGTAHADSNPMVKFGQYVGRRVLTTARCVTDDYPVVTDSVIIKPKGEIVEGYTRLHWRSKCFHKPYTSEVFWSFVNRPGKRRFFRVIYQDNHWLPCRVHQHNEVYLGTLNEDMLKLDMIDGGWDFRFSPYEWRNAEQAIPWR